jgi:enolase
MRYVGGVSANTALPDDEYPEDHILMLIAFQEFMIIPVKATSFTYDANGDFS